MFLTPQQAAADPCLRRRPSDSHRQVWLSLLWVSAPFPWALSHTRFVCAFQESLVGMGFDVNVIAPLLPSRCSVSFVLRRGVYFLVGPNILLSMDGQPLVGILVFSKERTSAHPSTPPSWMCSQAQMYIQTYHVIHFKRAVYCIWLHLNTGLSWWLWASLVAQTIKHLPAMQDTWV